MFLLFLFISQTLFLALGALALGFAGALATGAFLATTGVAGFSFAINEANNFAFATFLPSFAFFFASFSDFFLASFAAFSFAFAFSFSCSAISLLYFLATEAIDLCVSCKTFFAFFQKAPLI